MPQLDRIIIFPQIFWLFIVFILFYTTLTHFFLPKFLKSLKARKLVIEANEKEISSIAKTSLDTQAKLTFTLLNNLASVRRILDNNSTFSILNSNSLEIKKADELIGIAVKNSILFCNSQILDSINIYSKINLK